MLDHQESQTTLISMGHKFSRHEVKVNMKDKRRLYQQTFTCLKSTIETLGKGLKYVQSKP